MTKLDSARPRTRTFSSNTIRWGSLILVVITIIALGAVAYFTERGIVFRRDWVIHTYQVRSHLNDLQLEIMRAHAEETAYLLTPDKEAHPRSREQADLARQTVSSLRVLTRDNPRQQERLAQLEPLLEQGISLIESKRASAGMRTYVSSPQRVLQEEIDDRQKQIDTIVKAMQDEEEVLLEQRLKDWDYLFKRNVLMLGLAFAVVSVMLAYNFRLLISEVAQDQGQGEADTGKCRILPVDECQNSGVARLRTSPHCSRTP